MDLSYYPGCSLHSTAIEYDDSARAVFEAFGVRLHELEYWNCCGASSAHSLNAALALALPARNLSIAQKAGYDLAMPCAACFNRHKTAEYILRTDPVRRLRIEETAGFLYTGQVTVRPLLDVIANVIGLERVKERVRRPLYGLKAAAYYGCLLVRPPEIAQFDEPEHPQAMNRLLEALGAEPVAWSYATECCGGGLSLTKPGLAAKMVSRLAGYAHEAGARAIVTSCPLCQVNLEMRQPKESARLPVFYFTELIGLAFGLERAEKWWKAHLIDPTWVINSIPTRVPE